MNKCAQNTAFLYKKSTITFVFRAPNKKMHNLRLNC